MNKNANAALLVVVDACVVVIVVLNMLIKATSIAAIPTMRRRRAIRDRIKQTGERREQPYLK
jgi:hypothetical protein